MQVKPGLLRIYNKPGSMSWADPENELVAVYLPAKLRGNGAYRDFEKAIQQAIIE